MRACGAITRRETICSSQATRKTVCAPAAAIGDDRLQREAQGRVVPESFTHGSSAQRVEWLKRGLESGRLESCDTFNAR
jgi:predicted metalloprotease